MNYPDHLWQLYVVILLSEIDGLENKKGNMFISKCCLCRLICSNRCLPEPQPSLNPINHARWRSDMMIHGPRFLEMMCGHLSVINHSHIVNCSSYRKRSRSGTGNETWIYTLSFTENELWNVCDHQMHIQGNRLDLGFSDVWFIIDNRVNFLSWLNMGVKDEYCVIDSHNNFVFMKQNFNKHVIFSAE